MAEAMPEAMAEAMAKVMAEFGKRSGPTGKGRKSVCVCCGLTQNKR